MSIGPVVSDLVCSCYHVPYPYFHSSALDIHSHLKLHMFNEWCIDLHPVAFQRSHTMWWNGYSSNAFSNSLYWKEE